MSAAQTGVGCEKSPSFSRREVEESNMPLPAITIMSKCANLVDLEECYCCPISVAIGCDILTVAILMQRLVCRARAGTAIGYSPRLIRSFKVAFEFSLGFSLLLVRS